MGTVVDAKEDFLTRRLNSEGAELLEQFLLGKAKIVGVIIEVNDDGDNLFPDALIALFIKEGIAHVEQEMNVTING